MRASVLALVAGAAVCWGAGMARGEAELPAVVPEGINFQGRLVVEENGVERPLTGVQHVDFRLYAAEQGGTLVWERMFPVTCTDDGSFNVVLGDGGTILGKGAEEWLVDAFQGTERDFELEVEGYGTLAPRLRLSSAPYAFQAQYAGKGAGGFRVNGVLTVGGNATFKGAFTADSGSVTNLTVTKGGGTIRNLDVKGKLSVPEEKVKGAIPVGGILAWTQEDVPDGWAVCDGRTVKGVRTPDLRGRFVKGADHAYSPGTKGGAASVTLQAEQLPRHRHELPGGNAFETTRKVDVLWSSSDDDWWYVWFAIADEQGRWNGGGVTEPTGGDEATHATQPHENRPPYYAVYYIMRVE